MPTLSSQDGMLGLQISILESGDVTVLPHANNGEGELLNQHLRYLAANGKRKLSLNRADRSQVDSCGVRVIVEMCVYPNVRVVASWNYLVHAAECMPLPDAIPSIEDQTQAPGKPSAARLRSNTLKLYGNALM